MHIFFMNISFLAEPTATVSRPPDDFELEPMSGKKEEETSATTTDIVDPLVIIDGEYLIYITNSLCLMFYFI